MVDPVATLNGLALGTLSSLVHQLAQASYMNYR